MSFQSLVQSTLEQLNVPVFFMKKDDQATLPTYITWFEMLYQGEFYANGSRHADGHYIQVDIFSKGNYNALAKQLISVMEAAGFTLRDARDLPYEPETGFYHRTNRFLYIEEV